MHVFKSVDSFVIKNRGRIFAVESSAEIAVKEVLGQPVEIDGVRYSCNGVERFLTHKDRPMIAAGEKIGLLVEVVFTT